MAYDPKAFLTRALKEGFQPQYAGPQTSEDTNLTYLGDLATIDGVQVRPMTIGGTEEAPEFGHIVSAPLTGKYEGYYRNDIFDDKGNFLRTTISEPGTSGLTDLAKFALNAATFGGFGPAVTAAARGISALQAKNAPALLSAISGLPGVPAMPSAVSDVLKYAGQAKDLKKAIEGDPNAIFRTIVGAAKSGVLPKGVVGDIDLSGSDAIEGFFDPGGEGYAEPEASGLPAWALDPYKDDTPTFRPPSEEDYEELESILLRYPEQQLPQVEPKTTMSPNDMAKFLEANIDDPGTIDTLMQDYFPELYAQRIETTAKRQPTPEVIIPDWDILPDVITTPRSIRDVGNVTKVSPDEPLEGTTITEPDLSVGLPPAVTAPAPKPATPGKAPTPSPAPKAESKDPNMAWLAALVGMLGQQQPTQAPAPQQVARIDAESPFGLMYGMRG